MCLLDEVLEWDAQHILCRSSSHRSLDNPLRSHGQLGAACGVEYAAQAMAVHGVLVAATGAQGPAGLGYLASVRGVRVFVNRLDDLQSDLLASAARVTSNQTTVLYDFTLLTAERELLRGRATIIFDIGSGSGTHSAPV
jgi:predicted hotdog family 3-hydroxylacyl-ACP dehydratase